MIIFPSLASANQMCLKEEIKRVEGCGKLHFDIEDGNFVPNITFGIKTIKSAREVTEVDFDAHLMVSNPLAYVDELAQLNFKAISFHFEAAAYPLRIINAIHNKGIRAGVAINPRTRVQQLEMVLPYVDYVLVMTSEPDLVGDRFQPLMLNKVSWLRSKCGNNIEIITDGGIDSTTIKQVSEAGANGAVLGRAIFKADNPEEEIKKFMMIGD